MNNKYLMLALFAVVFHGASFPACRIYSLQSPCSIAFSDSRKMVYANRVEIFATEDADGRFSSPFKVSGYDKDGKLIYNTVFGAHYSDTNETPEVLLADSSEKIVVHRNIVQGDLSIGDGHFRISTRKPSGEFLVLVEDLDALRLEAEVETHVARMRANDMIAGSAEWPQMDDGRRYRCSCEEFVGLPQIDGGKSPTVDRLHLKGVDIKIHRHRLFFLDLFPALFLYGISTLGESAKGCSETVAKGSVVCEVVDGEIKNRVITYDIGEGIVEASISLPKRNETRGIGAGNAALERVLEKRGIKERPVRLSLAHGATKAEIDLDMQCNNR